jgi:hypothetical protein
MIRPRCSTQFDLLPLGALDPLMRINNICVDALRKHETGGAIPPTGLRRIRMARTRTRARLRPVRLTVLPRLLLHVSHNKSRPCPC